MALFTAAGIDELDAGYVRLGGRAPAKRFIESCRSLRLWDRPKSC